MRLALHSSNTEAFMKYQVTEKTAFSVINQIEDDAERGLMPEVHIAAADFAPEWVEELTKRGDLVAVVTNSALDSARKQNPIDLTIAKNWLFRSVVRIAARLLSIF
jgi:hypothetical protein